MCFGELSPLFCVNPGPLFEGCSWSQDLGWGVGGTVLTSVENLSVTELELEPSSPPDSRYWAVFFLFCT